MLNSGLRESAAGCFSRTKRCLSLLLQKYEYGGSGLTRRKAPSWSLGIRNQAKFWEFKSACPMPILLRLTVLLTVLLPLTALLLQAEGGSKGIRDRGLPDSGMFGAAAGLLFMLRMLSAVAACFAAAVFCLRLRCVLLSRLALNLGASATAFPSAPHGTSGMQVTCAETVTWITCVSRLALNLGALATAFPSDHMRHIRHVPHMYHVEHMRPTIA